MDSSAAGKALLEHFRWVDGHADVWRVFRHGNAFRLVVGQLAHAAREFDATAIVGVESRGFLLGGAVAAELGVGFVAVRKTDELLPGATSTQLSEPDYRGNRHQLRIQNDAVQSTDRLVLIDDWIEVGSQASAVQQLVTRLGARLVGIAVMVDQCAPAARRTLPPIQAIVSHAALPAGG